jgi:host cell factor
VPDVGLVVWAGQTERGFLDDLWVYDPVDSRWSRLAPEGRKPEARYGSCAALGPDGRLWISHGFTEDSGRFDDTWAFDFRASRWSKETPDGRLPVERCLHDCLWTPDGRFLLYGGQTTGTPALGDLWSRPIDAGWTRAQPPEPTERSLYALAVLDGSGYVFGGADVRGDRLDDLWQLDLASLAWTELRASGDVPAARSGAAMIADPLGSRLILFGGRSGSKAFDDLRVLSLPRMAPRPSAFP